MGNRINTVMENFIKNVDFKKNPWSTGIGLILVIVGIITVFMDEIQVLESITIIVLGAAFMGIKDPRISGGAKTLVWLLFALSIFSFGCAKKISIPQTITVRDTVRVPVEVYLKPDSVFIEVPITSIDSLPVGIISEQTNERSKITLFKTKDHKIRAKAECLPDTIRMVKEVPVEIKADCPPMVVKAPTFWQKAWEGYKTLSALLILLLLIVIGLMRGLNIK